MKSKVRIVLVGGGSGGHFYPLMGIAESLRESAFKPTLYYAGPEPYDEMSLQELGIEFVLIPAGKIRKYRSLLNFLDFFRTLLGTAIAILKLYIIYPDAIMSKGGYTSVPVTLAAIFLRIPIVIHESDSVMGSANKLVSRFSTEIIVSYQDLYESLSVQSANVHLLGTPVRKEMLKAPSPQVASGLGVTLERPTILVLGGSQGAERLNSLILDSLDEILPDYTIIHQTGKLHYDMCKISADTLIPDPELRKHYRPRAFFNATELNTAYHASQLVISRAGSNSIYEIAIHSKPSILIPIPETISHDQRTNAYAFSRAGGSVVMEEHNATDGLLKAEIDRIMRDTNLYQNMAESAQLFARRDTAERIKEILIEISQEH